MIRAALAKGWIAYKHHWLALVLASVCVVAASLPVGLLFEHVAADLRQLASNAESVGTQRGVKTVVEAVIWMLSPVLPCCGWTSVVVLAAAVLVAPVVAGACQVGLHAVSGRSALRAWQLSARGYLRTAAAGGITVLLGGGATVVAVLYSGVGVWAGVGAVLRAIEIGNGRVTAALLWGMIAAIICCIAWFSMRLWLALYRLLDDRRPRLGIVASIAWSWHSAAGPNSWRFLCALLVPLAPLLALRVIAMPQVAGHLATHAWIVQLAAACVALLVWLPLALATSGALYEELAVLGDRVPPPPPVPGV